MNKLFGLSFLMVVLAVPAVVCAINGADSVASSSKEDFRQLKEFYIFWWVVSIIMPILTEK